MDDPERERDFQVMVKEPGSTAETGTGAPEKEKEPVCLTQDSEIVFDKDPSKALGKGSSSHHRAHTTNDIEFLVAEMGADHPEPEEQGDTDADMVPVRRIASDTRISRRSIEPQRSSHGLAGLGTRRFMKFTVTSAGEDEAVAGDSGDVNHKKGTDLRRLISKKKKGDSVQMAYFQDENGEIRDEYGFKADENDSAYIVPALTKNQTLTPVPHETRKRILKKEERRRRRLRVWENLRKEAGGDLSSLDTLRLERWRRYVARSESGETVQKYLYRISSPSQSNCESEGSRQSQFSADASEDSLSPNLLRMGSKFAKRIRRKFKKDPDAAASHGHRRNGSNSGGHVTGQSNSVDRAMALKLTNAIRGLGIPPDLRRDVWLSCSGAISKKKAAGPEDQYEYLVNQATTGEKPAMADVIERDLHRTFPTNYHFEEEEGITRMRRVLLAYSLRNRSVGYCQSMNFLVAVLLLHMEEQMAFWALAAIVEDLVPGRYTEQMVGMHVDQKVFESLVKARLPKLFNHFVELSFPLEFVTYQWFLCLFVNSLPLDTTLRIWDCFLHEGSKALFRAGLAILMILQKQILSANTFQDVHDCLTLDGNPRMRLEITGDNVMKVAYDSIWFGSFPSQKIAHLRARHLPAVLESLGHQTEWEEFKDRKDVSGTSHGYNTGVTSGVGTSEGSCTSGNSYPDSTHVDGGKENTDSEIVNGEHFEIDLLSGGGSSNRRGSVSFKYQFQLSNDSETPMSRLGIKERVARPMSLSCFDKTHQKAKSHSTLLPRRASTNSPIVKRGDGGTFKTFALERQHATATHKESVSSNSSHVSGLTTQSDPQQKQSRGSLFSSPSDRDDSICDNDIPSEFSGLLPSLVYVMSARQINPNDNSSPRFLRRAMTDTDDDSSSYGAASSLTNPSDRSGSFGTPKRKRASLFGFMSTKSMGAARKDS